MIRISSLGPEDILEDSIFTWHFSARSGDSWGGTMIADSLAFAPGDTVEAEYRPTPWSATARAVLDALG